jgi:hypothetical protein
MPHKAIHRPDGQKTTLMSVTNTGAIVGMAGSGQNPLSYPVGSSSWSMTTYIDAVSNTGHVAYQHTCYPAHQVKVANTTLYSYRQLITLLSTTV